MLRLYKYSCLRRAKGNVLLGAMVVFGLLLMSKYLAHLFIRYQGRASFGERIVKDLDSESFDINNECGNVCKYGQVSFLIKTGDLMDTPPTICFNGIIELSPSSKNHGRGLNTIFVNPVTLEVIGREVFDSYIDEESLVKYFKEKVPDQTIVLMATFDDGFNRLKDEGKSALSSLGSEKVFYGKFRESFLLIGQKGLRKGHAIEFHERVGKTGFGDSIQKRGCFSIPMGPFGVEKPTTQPKMIGAPAVTLKNCEVPNECGTGSVPVMVYTGTADKDMPQICVSGNIYLQKDWNDAGRGFNIVVMDGETLAPNDVVRFDTYNTDSANMDEFLNGLKKDSIVIAVVSDDGAKKLSSNTRTLLQSFGSSMIQNLKFRDVWYFIGQKGIKGFTPFEMISYAQYDDEWPKTLRQSMCIPHKIKSLKVPPESSTNRNEERRAFCKKYDGYPEFCSARVVDEKLKATERFGSNKIDDDIFSVPIIIIPGMDPNAFVRVLETTLMQPGIEPKNVLVAFDQKFPEHLELASLFGYRNVSLESSLNYAEQMKKAITTAWKIVPDNAKFMIVLEEEIILSPDFLDFMGQCLPLLKNDPTLHGVSAWNPNGFKTTSGNRSLLYRVQDFPGLAFMLKRETYEKYMKQNMDKCCSGRFWDGWHIDANVQMVLPDVSRVYRQPPWTTKLKKLETFFQYPRATNVEGAVALAGVQDMVERNYEDIISQQIGNSSSLSPREIYNCTQSKLVVTIADNLPYHIALFYEQKDEKDIEPLAKLCKCFGLLSSSDQPLKNIYKGLIRFYFQRREVFLVGSATSFYKHKPQKASFLTKQMLAGS